MSKDSDRRLTPEWLLNLVREFAGGQIALDVCTEPHNPTGAETFFHPGGSCGLAVVWHSALQRLGDWRIPVAWANVPYSTGQVARWSQKAVDEARLGAEILLLTKDDCRPKWNRFLRDNADARCRIAKGVGFLEPDEAGGFRQLVGPQWGSCLWLFGRHRRRFERIFGAIGEVIHGLGPQEPR